MKKLFVFVTALSLSASVCAYDGPATEQDIENWKSLAVKGNAEAQYNLAEAYSEGDGVTLDKLEAAKWYERAANQGYIDAQMAMGFIYRGGEGRSMDKVMSYMWFDIAAKGGNASAFNLRNNVAWSMTESEIKEGRKKSKEWKPSIYTDE